MDNNYLESLNQAFDESAPPSKEKLLSLMDETMAFFQGIKAKLESKNPEEREAALQETLEMKRVLESKIRILSEKSGLDPAQLSAFVQDPNNLSPEERDAVDEVQAKFEQLQQGEKKATKKHYLKTQMIN